MNVSDLKLLVKLNRATEEGRKDFKRREVQYNIRQDRRDSHMLTTSGRQRDVNRFSAAFSSDSDSDIFIYTGLQKK